MNTPTNEDLYELTATKYGYSIHMGYFRTLSGLNDSKAKKDGFLTTFTTTLVTVPVRGDFVVSSKECKGGLVLP